MLPRQSFGVILFSLCFIILLLPNSYASNNNSGTQQRELITPTGQTYSDLISVYLTGYLNPDMKPCLRILKKTENVVSTGKYPAECQNAVSVPYFLPIEMATNSVIKGSRSQRAGTLMLFNLMDYESKWYLPGTEFKFVLYWQENNVVNIAIAQNDVYIGSFGSAFLCSIVIVLLILLFLSSVAGKHRKGRSTVPTKTGILCFVCNQYGLLMLPLVQMAIWTIAIGAVVLAFALVGFENQALPESLVALMGLSAATGVAGHWQSKKIDERMAFDNGGKTPSINVNPIYAMVCVRTSNDECFPSLAKAQMLFWTVITVGIFVYKSVTEGALWIVPDELVLLMGISQAGFLGREQLEVNKPKNNKIEHDNNTANQ